MPPCPPSSQRLFFGLSSTWWFCVPLALLWFLLIIISPGLRILLGFGGSPTWLDAHAILSALDASRLGLDVYQPNPLDYANRPHVYSSLWLPLQYLGLGRQHLLPFGLFCILSFLIPALLFFRPTAWKEALWFAAFMFSPQVGFALFRGNNDLIIFGLLSAVVPCLRGSTPVIRSLPLFLILFATGLKYYPATAFVLLLTEPDRSLRRLKIIASVFLLVALAIILREDLARIPSLKQSVSPYFGVGAELFFSCLGAPAALTLPLSLVTAFSVILITWPQRAAAVWSEHMITDRAYLYLLLGASLYAGCYWLGASYAYRLVFLLWMIPFLSDSHSCQHMPRWLRSMTKIAAWLFLWVLLIRWPLLLVFKAHAWLNLEPMSDSTWRMYCCWIEVGQFLLALFCTMLVSNMVFGRLRAPVYATD